jgi:hypothetical protein
MPRNFKRADGTTALTGAAGSGAQTTAGSDLDAEIVLTEAVYEEHTHNVTGVGQATGKTRTLVYPAGAVVTKRQFLKRAEAALPVIGAVTPAAGARTGTLAYTIAGTDLLEVETFAWVNDKGVRFPHTTKTTHTGTSIAGNVAFGGASENIVYLDVRVAGVWYRAKTL